MPKKLNQVIAVEKGIRQRVMRDVTDAHKLCAKPELFSGFSKTYERLNDADEELPAESKKVQFKTIDMLQTMANRLTELIDVEADKDWANCSAVASVEVAGKEIIKDAPVSFLLFLEKQLDDIRTFIAKLPLLDENEDWKFDEVTGLHKTEAGKTHRTKKLQKPIVLYDATKEHPAQAVLTTEDVLVGYWSQTKFSGAYPKPKQVMLLERVDKLHNAVKFAREKANEFPLDQDKSIGSPIFDYLRFDG